jgi:hypothetical protein
MNRRAFLPRRGFVALAVTSGLSATACYDSTWVVKRELAPFRLPRRVVIMVWKSPRVRELDESGITDTLVVALEEELINRGFFPTVTSLDEPVLPRVELVFSTPPSEAAGTGGAGQRAITVDCAFVSAKDEVAFVGRVRGNDKDGDVAVAVQAAARAVADALAGG